MTPFKTNKPSKLVDETRTCVIKLTSTRDPTQIETAIKKCKDDILLMNAELTTESTIVDEESIIASVALMEGFLRQMKNLQVTDRGQSSSNSNPANDASVEWVNLKSVFTLYTGAVLNHQNKKRNSFLKNAKDLFRREIDNTLKKELAVEINSVLCAEFVTVRDGKDIFEFKSIKTKKIQFCRDTNIKKCFNDHIQKPILEELEEFLEEENCTLQGIKNITFNVNRFFPLPKLLKGESACINVRNNDDASFAWSVVAALHPTKKRRTSTSSYPHFSKILKLEDITMPMRVEQIPQFETQNNISINVYALEKFKNVLNVVSAYLTKKKQEKHVNLLLIQDKYVNENGEESDDNNDKEAKPCFHYVYIKYLDSFIAQFEVFDIGEYMCDRCLNFFTTEEELEAHTNDCLIMNDCKVKLPAKQQANIKFYNFKNKKRVPFIIYADLECLLEPTQNESVDSVQKLCKHLPYNIGYFVKCAYDDSLCFYKSYRGEDCQRWFAQELKQFAEDKKNVFLQPAPKDSSVTKTSCCTFCEERFRDGELKENDYCHFTGKCNGTIHTKCSSKWQHDTTIPVVFHNLTDYDSHFIIKNLAKDFEGRIDVLARSKERYISFTKTITGNPIKFRFIDSFPFLQASLSTLTSCLNEFPNLKKQFRDLNKTKFKLLTRKGVYPYDYVDSFPKLDETNLPDKSKFYNTLTNSDITDEDYARAKDVWDAFDCKNLGEYSDLYLKTDTLLLADVFEHFRSSCLKSYTLDPAHYFTLAGYTWDCMLKFTKINLELLTDIDKVLFIEKGIRGGLAQCSKRYSKANNKYLINHQPDLPSKFLIYFDINNQYGWAMSEYMPYGGLQWVEGNLNDFDYDVPENNPEGYILEVDLNYPDTIHDSHSDLPFCPEHRTPPNSKEKKLMATLYNKEHYILHYRNLQQAIKNGLILTKIHRVLKFKQSDWLKPYIEYNTQFRTKASNDFEKNLYKLMNNAIYGKTMENVRNYSNVKLLTKWEGRYGAEAQIAKPNFKSSTVFDENFVAIELNRAEIYLNKPIYIGVCVLDISKTKIYDFHYSYMKERFGDKARVCYTDTDSLIYEVECDDLYETIRCDAQTHFDTSNYQENNIYNIPRVNQKVVGMMKDVNGGEVMTEFVGIRPKNYAMRIGSIETLKGVNNSTLDRKITFDDYIKCLKENNGTEIKQMLFKSENHEVYTVLQERTVLNPDDDKRYIIPGTYETLPWGHQSVMHSS